MNTTLRALLAATAIASAASVAGAATIGYTIGSNGQDRLISFDATKPSVIKSVRITDGNGKEVKIEALDHNFFNSTTGELYGYGRNGDQDAVYRINPTTGVATFVSAATNRVEGTDKGVGFDFNNRIDRVRIVSAERFDARNNTVEINNLVANPNGGPIIDPRANPYSAGPPATGISELRPAVGENKRDFELVANAYTEALTIAQIQAADALGGTTPPRGARQFVLDGKNNMIGTLANNDGFVDLLATVHTTIDGQRYDIEFDDETGFDFVSKIGSTANMISNTGFFATAFEFGKNRNKQEGYGLFSFDLINNMLPVSDGKLSVSFLGFIGDGDDSDKYRGLTLVHMPEAAAVAPVPLPAPALLLLGGLSALGLMRRRASRA